LPASPYHSDTIGVIYIGLGENMAINRILAGDIDAMGIYVGNCPLASLPGPLLDKLKEGLFFDTVYSYTQNV
jgi:hypothetical protein